MEEEIINKFFDVFHQFTNKSLSVDEATVKIKSIIVRFSLNFYKEF